jgi:DNA repair protein RecN (Recombination protein N)
MLTQLRIRNFALIEELELEFAGGFNVLTGETGAGKSILIDAINAVLGSRAEPEWLRTGADRAIIEAVFELVEGSSLMADGSNEIDDTEPSTLNPRPPTCLSDWAEDGLLIVSRELTRAGRSQCRLNGRLCTTGTLREVAGGLIDLHGQHDHQSLLHSERHVDLLDAWAGQVVLDLRGRVEAECTAWREAHRTLAVLRTDERDRARQVDLYQFQINEIDAAKPVPGEEEELLADRLRLANAEKLFAAGAGALQALGEGNVSALDLLASAAREVEAAQVLDSTLAPVAESLQTALIAAEDAASELRAYQEAIEFNPERLEQVQDRLDLLRTLKKKYGDTLEEVIEYQQRIETELHTLTHSEERIAALEAELQQRSATLDQLSGELFAARRAAAGEFEQRLVAELRDLSMQNTRFEVRIEPPPHAAGLRIADCAGGGAKRGAGPRGEAVGRISDEPVPNPQSATRNPQSSPNQWLGRAEFLISPNPGEPVKPLARIASGGEMSRIMLALKSVMAGTGRPARSGGRTVPTLIFDEIDAGVGGRTAQVLGEKIAALSQTGQVLCVTHLPQIAGMATRHIHIEKRVDEGRTLVEARLLEDTERIEELARMLGGKAETAAQHARELLAVGGRKGSQERVYKSAQLPGDEPCPPISPPDARLSQPVTSRSRARRRA